MNTFIETIAKVPSRDYYCSHENYRSVDLKSILEK